MLKRILLNRRIFVAAVLGAIFLAQANDVFAGHQSTRRPPYPIYDRKDFTMPSSYISIGVGGFRFYYQDRARRDFRSRRYVFVPAPVVCVPERIIVGPTYKEVFVVHIPNSNGSYTSVTLQKSGNGYIGPQGEYYPNNPTVEQLRALYGK